MILPLLQPSLKALFESIVHSESDSCALAEFIKSLDNFYVEEIGLQEGEVGSYFQAWRQTNENV